MKKLLLTIIITIISINLFAQNDTTLIRKPVQFEIEKVTTKTGKSVVKYYAIIDGKYFDSSKTAAKRYYQTIKFGGTPNVAIVSNKKKTNRKVIIL